MLNTLRCLSIEVSLLLETLFNADQALSIGLVDKVVQDRETCLAEAHKIVTTMMKIPSEARHVSKMLMRQETLDRLTKNKEADIEHFTTFITQPVIQKPLGKYLEALKAKSKKK